MANAIYPTVDDIMKELRASNHRAARSEKASALSYKLGDAWQNNGISRRDYCGIVDKLSAPLSKILDKYNGNGYNNGLEEKVAERLYTEAELLSEIGFTKNQMQHLLRKTSVYEADELARKYSKTVVSAALKSANPLQAAERYQSAYEKVKQYAQAKGCSIAGTIASAAFRSADPLAAAQRYIENYEKAKNYLIRIGNAEKAKILAARVFRAANPIESVKKYLTETERVVADVIEHTGIEYEKKKADELDIKTINIKEEINSLKSGRIKTESDILKLKMRIMEFENYVQNSELTAQAEKNLRELKKIIDVSSQTEKVLKDSRENLQNFEGELKKLDSISNSRFECYKSELQSRISSFIKESWNYHFSFLMQLKTA